MCLHTPPWLRVVHTPYSQCCDISKLTSILPFCNKHMQNALSFKKMYTLWGLSCVGIKVQHRKWTNVSFVVIFQVKVSCVLKEL